MAKKTVGVPPREKPEDVARRIEDLVGVEPGKGRAPGQLNVMDRMVQLEERLAERSEKVEALFALVDDLGVKYTEDINKQNEINQKLTSENEEFSNLVSRIERLETRLDDMYTQIDQDTKDVTKIEGDVNSVKSTVRNVDRQFNEYQNTAMEAYESLEARLALLEMSILPNE